jgi:hypothetical protein
MHGGALSTAFYDRARSAHPARPGFHLPLAADELVDTIENAAADLGYFVI